MDETRARHLVDTGLETYGHRPTTNREWANVLGNASLRARVDYSDTPEDDFAADAVPSVLTLRHIAEGTRDSEREPRRTAKHRDPFSPPEWWEAESQRRLNAYRRVRDMLRLEAGLDEAEHDLTLDPRVDAVPFGLPKPYPLESVAKVSPLIRAMIRRQFAWWGEDYGLDALDPEDGVTELDLHRYEWDVIEYPAKTWEQDGATERVPFPPVGLNSRHRDPELDRLHRRSLQAARDLGITQAECLAWALTDVPFTIPWIRTTEVHQWTWDGEWSTLSILVNSESATAQAVAKAYTTSRTAVGGQTPVRRAPGPWPARVAAFVEQRRRDTPGEPWSQLFDVFREEYGEHYKNVRAFQTAFYESRQKGAKS